MGRGIKSCIPALSSQDRQGGAMSHLMKLAEALRDIAEERDESEIEQALGLCSGFADRVTNEPKDATTHFEPLWQLMATRCSRIPN